MGTFAPPTGSTLTSRYDAVVYTASGAVATIQADVPGSSQPEPIYTGTAFEPGYSSSSRAGDVYTLRRNAGWLNGVTIHVDESAAVDDVVIDASGNFVIDAFANSVVP